MEWRGEGGKERSGLCWGERWEPARPMGSGFRDPCRGLGLSIYK